jgi:hypothetical protein
LRGQPFGVYEVLEASNTLSYDKVLDAGVYLLRDSRPRNVLT